MQRIIKNAEKKVQEKLKPLGELSLSIVRGAWDCAQGMNSMLDAPDERGKKEAEMLVFYEFLYFFMHITMRMASMQLTEQQIKKLQDFLGPLISSTAVDSFCASWPKNLKEKIQSEFYERLNDAELEYSTCKELFGEKNRLTGNSLFSVLARNVAELSGNSMNPAVLTLVVSRTADTYAGLHLDSLVNNVGKVL